MDFLILVMVAAFGALLVARSGRSLQENERRIVWFAFTAHIVAAIFQVVITKYYYGGGDMMGYFERGQYLADYLMAQPGRAFPQLLDLLAHGTPAVPEHIIGAGSATGAMASYSAFALIPTFGSLYGACLLFSLFALSGQIALYRVVREVMPAVLQTRAAAAVFLVPSVVFWSSAILKESVALAGIGWAILGVRRLLFTGKPLAGGLMLAMGGFIAATTKPYALFVLAISAAIWFYWFRTRGESASLAWKRPLYLGLGVALAAGTLVWLGDAYPQYALDNVTEEAARVQQAYYGIEGGSTYQFASAAETSAEAQTSFVPMALVSALFRPFAFEVHNLTSAINGVEMLLIALAFLYIVFKRGPLESARFVSRSPFLMFCVAFTLLFGIAVGLGAPNLGSLSRYRILMMPMYVLVLLSLLPPPRSQAAKAADKAARTKRKGVRRRLPGYAYTRRTMR